MPDDQLPHGEANEPAKGSAGMPAFSRRFEGHPLLMAAAAAAAVVVVGAAAVGIGVASGSSQRAAAATAVDNPAMSDPGSTSAVGVPELMVSVGTGGRLGAPSGSARPTASVPPSRTATAAATEANGATSADHPAVAPPPPPATASPKAAPKTTAPTGETIAGQLSCSSGRSVEGVWVQAGSGSGFAPWSGIGDGASASYSYRLPTTETYALHVGCGGTPQSWAVSADTPVVSGSHSFDCFDISSAADYGTCVVG
jgi:hypothetical protein